MNFYGKFIPYLASMIDPMVNCLPVVGVSSYVAKGISPDLV